jgi:hypothetical protein
VSLLARAWLAPALLRRQLHRLRRRSLRDELIARHVPGRSFADIGCMWGSHGEVAFLAEEAGATQVTAFDMMGETPEFKAEHRRRSSQVRFVQGDLHAPDAVERVGVHDAVWCTGILCVDAAPIVTLTRLRALTREVLIVDAATIPEVPGIPQATVFYPGLSDEQRRLFLRTNPGGRRGISQPFDPTRPGGSWWWGLTPSAFRGMLFSVGLEPVEWRDEGFHVTVVARPISVG